MPKEKLRELLLVAVKHQIAQAGKAHQRFAPGAQSFAQPRQFGEAARQKGGARILAQPQAFDHAAGDGIDILGGAAQRHAGDVVAGVGPKCQRAQTCLQPPRHIAVGGDGDGGGQSLGDIAREGGSRENCRPRLAERHPPPLRSPACRFPFRCPWRRSPAACPARSAAQADARNRASTCAGTARSRASARAASASAPVTDKFLGKITPGRKRSFSWALAMSATTSSSRAHNIVSRPALMAASASAVPQAPPPRTAMRE